MNDTDPEAITNKLIQTEAQGGIPIEHVGKGLINRKTPKNEEVFQAFRDIRTQLTQSGECRVTMISSVVKGGGSTFVAVNLATTFAMQVGRQSVIVDCNFGDPGVASILGLPDGKGLADYLDNPKKTHLRDIIRPTRIRGLFAVSAGEVKGVTEYITSPHLGGFLNDVQDALPFANIVADAPSTQLAADARVLSQWSDKVVLVVPYARATAARIKAASEIFDADKLAGVVFNQEPG